MVVWERSYQWGVVSDAEAHTFFDWQTLFNFMSDCVLDFPKVTRGFHSSLVPTASGGQIFSSFVQTISVFSFKLMKSAIWWKGVIVSIWSVKLRWVDHQLAITASWIPWKPLLWALLSKEYERILNFSQIASISGMGICTLFPNLDFVIPDYPRFEVTLVVTPFILSTHKPKLQKESDARKKEPCLEWATFHNLGISADRFM